MRIQSLQLSGFKGFERLTTINFLDEHQNLVFDTQGPDSQFFVCAILGIIFGLNAEEKQEFRGDPRLNQTFTGLVSLVLDRKVLMIERDFETDVIACLLTDPQSSRPIFQGKDIVDNGFSRPYLDMLKSLFPLVDKSLYLEVLNEDIMEGKPLSHLLTTLYLLFSPSFKLNRSRSLLHQAETISQEIFSTRLDANSISQLHQFRRYLSTLQQIEELRLEMIGDLNKLNHLTEHIRQRHKHRDRVKDNLAHEYQPLLKFNPVLLRAEVLLWKSLEQLYEQNRAELETIEQEMARLEKRLHDDWQEMAQLPAGADREFRVFDESLQQKQQLETKIRQNELEIKLNEAKYRTWRHIKWLMIGLAGPLVVVFSFFLFHSWTLIISEAFFFTLLFMFLFGHYHAMLRDRLTNLKEERDIYIKKRNDANRRIQTLKSRWAFLRDMNSYQRYKQKLNQINEMRTRYRILKRKRKKVEEGLGQPSFTRQLASFRNKYDKLIDIQRTDLESFLDKFVRMKNEVKTIDDQSPTPPVVQSLQDISHQYRQSIQKLKHAYDAISDRLNLHQYNMPLSQILEAIDRRIKNIELKTGIPFEY